MQTEYINIITGQHLKDVLPEIPSNIILNKTITGCGATTLEITSERHSIIIEPNVPVILGKKEKYPDICCVHEGVSIDDIKSYLRTRQTGQYAKIVTTPEGFKKKVLVAINGADGFTRDSFFLLFDECEKLVQDVDFRDNICIPIDDFFEFENKAMVSATPITPSDPRFEEQGFSIFKINPQYDYKHKIRLCVTDRPQFALERMIRTKQFNRKRYKLCIFLNHIGTIRSVIKKLDISEQSKVFCSNNSFDKLKGIVDYDDKISELKDFNFFTSRFFSAVDIELSEQPYVIIYTDWRINSTIIDPRTESAQICGRFRNGIKHIDHITNTEWRLQWSEGSVVRKRLQAEENFYFTIRDIPLPSDVYLIDEQRKALSALNYHRFITERGNRNYFMWDNECYEQKIRRAYTTVGQLKTAYMAMFKPEIIEKSQLSEKEHLCSPESWEKVFSIIEQSNREGKDPQRYYQKIKSLGLKVMIDAYEALGVSGIRELSYDLKKIESAIKAKAQYRQLIKQEVRDAIYAQYNVGDTVPCKKMRDFLDQLFKENGINLGKKIDKNIVEAYFEIEDTRTNRNTTRAYMIKSKRL